MQDLKLKSNASITNLFVLLQVMFKEIIRLTIPYINSSVDLLSLRSDMTLLNVLPQNWIIIQRSNVRFIIENISIKILILKIPYDILIAYISIISKHRICEGVSCKSDFPHFWTKNSTRNFH